MILRSSRSTSGLRAAASIARTALILCLTVAVCYMAARVQAQGRLFTEFGGGVKLTASNVIESRCSTVYVEFEWRHTYSCGGDNPVFVGWPIAWEFPNGARLGWFHMSHWFDGKNNPALFQRGDGRETYFNCLCATWRRDWKRRN